MLRLSLTKRLSTWTTVSRMSTHASYELNACNAAICGYPYNISLLGALLDTITARFAATFQCGFTRAERSYKTSSTAPFLIDVMSSSVMQGSPAQTMWCYLPHTTSSELCEDLGRYSYHRYRHRGTSRSQEC